MRIVERIMIPKQGKYIFHINDIIISYILYRWDNNCEKLEEYIPLWLNLGVKIIGGCCRVCASYIGKIKEEVDKWLKNG